MKRRQLLCALLALCFALSWIPARATTVEPFVGPETYNWAFDEATGTLNITGTGDMPSFTADNSPPWLLHSGSITTVVIGEGITGIGDMAFSESFKAVTSVTLPSTLTKIGNYAFYQCYGLREITLPGSLTQISEYAFSRCSSLSKVVIPSGTVSIGKGAFAGCGNLSEVTFSGTVAEIGQIAFAETGLVDVTVPENVTKIGTNAFGACPKLTNVAILNPQCELEEYILGEYILEGENAATISGFAGSTAQSHAKACGYSFRELDRCSLYGHTYEQTGFAATCEDRGYTRYSCTVCGYCYENSYIDALGHSFGDWVQVKAPTSTQPGEAQRTCERCGEREYMDVPKLNPDPTDPAPTTPADPTDPTEETAPDTEPDATVAPTDPTQPDTQPSTDPEPTVPAEPKPPRKSSPWGWIVGIVLILVAGGGAAAWYFLIYQKQPVGKFSGYHHEENDDYGEPEEPDEE